MTATVQAGAVYLLAMAGHDGADQGTAAMTLTTGTPDAPGTAHDAARIDAALDLVRPHVMIPAFKSIMATLNQDPAWLRVRAPLVAMDAATHAAFSATIGAFAIDRARE